MQDLASVAGIGLANWNWKVVREFVLERFGIELSRSSCLNWLHRLGFAFKRPKKRLVKVDEAKREAFVAEYAALWGKAGRTGGKIFFADEAHFRAEAELRGKWVLKGEPASVDSSSPRRGEKASYYSAVCLETGEVEWMELDGTGWKQKRRNLGRRTIAKSTPTAKAAHGELVEPQVDGPATSSGLTWKARVWRK